MTNHPMCQWTNGPIGQVTVCNQQTFAQVEERVCQDVTSEECTTVKERICDEVIEEQCSVLEEEVSYTTHAIISNQNFKCATPLNLIFKH